MSSQLSVILIDQYLNLIVLQLLMYNMLMGIGIVDEMQGNRDLSIMRKAEGLKLKISLEAPDDIRHFQVMTRVFHNFLKFNFKRSKRSLGSTTHVESSQNSAKKLVNCKYVFHHYCHIFPRHWIRIVFKSSFSFTETKARSKKHHANVSFFASCGLQNWDGSLKIE